MRRRAASGFCPAADRGRDVRQNCRTVAGRHDPLPVGATFYDFTGHYQYANAPASWRPPGLLGWVLYVPPSGQFAWTWNTKNPPTTLVTIPIGAYSFDIGRVPTTTDRRVLRSRDRQQPRPLHELRHHHQIQPQRRSRQYASTSIRGLSTQPRQLHNCRTVAPDREAFVVCGALRAYGVTELWPCRHCRSGSRKGIVSR